MQRHLNTLSEEGYSMLLIGRKRKSSKALNEQKFKQKRLSCWFEKGKLFYLEYNLRLFIYLLFAPCDIIVSVDYDTLLPGTIVSKIRGKKLVFDAHEFFTEVPELYNRKWSRFIWEMVGKICISKVDLAYTVGPILAELFTKEHNVKFHSILNVPPLRSEGVIGSDRKDKPIILYQGALNKGRGIEELMMAMKQVNAELWIAGEGDLSSYLRELCSKENLTEKVRFLGFVLPQNLPLLTQQADICCNLLLPNGKSYYYSLANKFFDYMHAAKPQICANFPEYIHINKEFEIAILCDAEPKIIADSLTKLLTDKDLYKKLKNNCFKAAQVYNLQMESKKLVQLYSTL